MNKIIQESLLDKFIQITIRIILYLITISAIFFVGYITAVYCVMSSQGQENHKNALIVERADGIHFDGAITHESMHKLLKAIDASEASEPTVWLESGGGDVDAAFNFALMVANRPLRTAVGQNAFCASACNILFLSGSTRYADPTAALALHGPYCFSALPDLECLAEKSYIFAADDNKRFMAQKNPEWYKKALADKAFSYPPERVFCYNFPNGADKSPVSQNESDKVRANCALASTMFNTMQPEYRQQAQSPVGAIQRLAMIGRWLTGRTDETVRQDYPQ
ncbi:hypothetical protein [Acetobacter fabarum]|uniref:hypothetical protein n=1 Tax=Acetobacter fabarum TaxID=483199 RepID=UPI0020A19807|nr:hypothetical protein [Acetobacter fabarum]MCP1229344.1 hypothetical protein [Acetobacter fabarum]MCP1234862.1 hypothetical protein [Acetobacter fabarum]